MSERGLSFEDMSSESASEWTPSGDSDYEEETQSNSSSDSPMHTSTTESDGEEQAEQNQAGNSHPDQPGTR